MTYDLYNTSVIGMCVSDYCPPDEVNEAGEDEPVETDGLDDFFGDRNCQTLMQKAEEAGDARKYVLACHNRRLRPGNKRLYDIGVRILKAEAKECIRQRLSEIEHSNKSDILNMMFEIIREE